MKHIISMVFALSLLWVMLSAHFEPLMLSFGVVSVFLSVYLALRMEVIDHESHPFHLTLHLPGFWLMLFWEIIKANYDVVLRVLGIRPISPTLVELPVPHKNDLSRVIYANSITLTPGTVSIDVSDDMILVHALSEDGAKDLRTGYLASLVPDLEAAEDS